MQIDSSQKLERKVKLFQNLLITGIESPFAILERFPSGSCKLCSMLLAKYLVKNGLAAEDEIFLVANGLNEYNDSHAWLIVGDMIVDITAFQFDDSITNVIFSNKSELHRQFKGATPYPYESFMRNLATDWAKDFSTTFQNIVKALAEPVA